VIDLVESVHVELTNEGLPVAVLEVVRKDVLRELRGGSHPEELTLFSPTDHVSDGFIFKHSKD